LIEIRSAVAEKSDTKADKITGLSPNV